MGVEVQHDSKIADNYRDTCNHSTIIVLYDPEANFIWISDSYLLLNFNVIVHTKLMQGSGSQTQLLDYTDKVL